MIEPTSGNRMVNTVVLVFTLISGMVVALRLFTRGLMLRNLGIEDVFMTLAMVLVVGFAVTVAIQIMNGMGLHVYEVPEKEFIISQKAFWGSIWIYNLSLTLTKLSILTQYLRIFPSPRFQLNCNIAIAVVSLWGTWTLFGNMFMCTPVPFFWDKSIPDGRCLNQAAVWFTNASVNIVQDIIILAMPIAMLRSLDIPSRQKKALIIVFAFGAIVCVVSIIRLQTLVAIANSKDPTYDNLAAAMLSAIEANMGIICACLPSMRPLFSALMPAYFPSTCTFTARRTYDEERVKHLRFHSDSTLAHPTRAASKASHSRSGSTSSQLRTPTSAKTLRSSAGSSHSSRAQSRDGTELNTIQRPPSTYHSRTQSEPLATNSSNNLSISHPIPHPHTHSRNGSQPNLLTSYTSPSPSPWLRSGANSPALSGTTTASVHHQHKLHPLRMQPAIPETPRLPRLPEDMAAFGDPFQQSQRPSAQSTPRKLVFSKPLPITPYPIPIT
ncbi:hypothetical protein DM02DRAFT_414617 [Periconia macrospinosa]|uniref:Rhodopsin domain-containing protein n=1 Tax=Periconia macrospinosa TaxID=97972 RepID=A0A2V1DRF0_9PLEO|nr:hypothetical protein DM02DRAFT_414617 [Periconia macrospinosa]